VPFILSSCVLYVYYCTKLSKSGCNMVRRIYSMRAPTRNAMASAMTSDQVPLIYCSAASRTLAKDFANEVSVAFTEAVSPD